MSETKDAAGVTEDFDLLAFVATGTIARREVVIYNDHEAARECQRLQEAIDAADDEDPKTDGPLGGDFQSKAELEAEAASWLERLQASKMTWTVRALSAEEIDRAYEAVPDPKMPTPPKDGAAQGLKDRFTERWVAYQVDVEKAKADRRLVLIAAAVESIETPAGVSGAITAETLRSLRGKPHGQGWIDRLWAAVDEASSEEVEPPVPTSPGRSTSSRG